MTGVTLSNFAPREPPVVATSENLFKSAVACQSRLIFCVPTFLEVGCVILSLSEVLIDHQEWSQSQEKVSELQKFEAIVSGLSGYTSLLIVSSAKLSIDVWGRSDTTGCW